MTPDENLLEARGVKDCGKKQNQFRNMEHTKHVSDIKDSSTSQMRKYLLDIVAIGSVDGLALHKK